MPNLKRKFIEAITLSDAWFQLLYGIIEEGREFKIDKGSYAGEIRREYDWVDIHILQPWHRDTDGLPLVPEMPESMGATPPPVAKEFVPGYSTYLMTAKKEPGEDYTYGERLAGYLHLVTQQPLSIYYDTQLHFGERVLPPVEFHVLNQIEHVISTYQQYGPRNNQMVLQVARPEDLLLNDPPCLRHIDTRIQDGKLHFFPYFRSWDLWGGFPANMTGISYLQEYMAGEIGVEQGEIICSSKGLHIYGYAKEIAEIRCHK